MPRGASSSPSPSPPPGLVGSGATARDLPAERPGKPAETRFKLLKIKNNNALLEAKPVTGRMHQIRVHLATLGHPVIGDVIYGTNKNIHTGKYPLALRSVRLIFKDPFEKNLIDVKASIEDFLLNYGFEISDWKRHS